MAIMAECWQAADEHPKCMLGGCMSTTAVLSNAVPACMHRCHGPAQFLWALGLLLSIVGSA